VKLKDGSFAYVSGWCDTTGWGCQDGARITRFAQEPELKTIADEDWSTAVNDLQKALTDGDRP
jgi:hypothetical protein